MQHKKIRFDGKPVDLYFDGNFARLKELVDKKTAIILTDENVFDAHTQKFRGWNTIVLKAGEGYKIQATVDAVIAQLIEMGAGRNTVLVGVGGGVITDLAGYIAAIFMRGIPVAFVPTTLLAMVDAAIGGKNGIDVEIYKNMVGTVHQPAFILYDLAFLKTLPEEQWRSGFAEVVKHACIADAGLFRQLEINGALHYRKKKVALAELVQKNALLKTKIVLQDPYEQGLRRILNFGHTLGHALENQYELTHGEAISIGMYYAAGLSGKLGAFRHAERVGALLEQYGLPTAAQYDKNKVMPALRADKKKSGAGIHFVLLEKIGKAFTMELPFSQIEATL